MAGRKVQRSSPVYAPVSTHTTHDRRSAQAVGRERGWRPLPVGRRRRGWESEGGGGRAACGSGPSPRETWQMPEPGPPARGGAGGAAKGGWELTDEQAVPGHRVRRFHCLGGRRARSCNRRGGGPQRRPKRRALGVGPGGFLEMRDGGGALAQAPVCVVGQEQRSCDALLLACVCVRCHRGTFSWTLGFCHPCHATGRGAAGLWLANGRARHPT